MAPLTPANYIVLANFLIQNLPSSQGRGGRWTASSGVICDHVFATTCALFCSSAQILFAEPKTHTSQHTSTPDPHCALQAVQQLWAQRDPDLGLQP